MYTTYFTHDICSWSGLLVIYSTLFECNVGLETSVGILVASSELFGCSTSVVTLVRMLVVSSVRLYGQHENHLRVPLSRFLSR